MRCTGRRARALAVCGLVAAGTLWAGVPARAQFNGDFAVEQHALSDENFLDWKAYQPTIQSRYRWYPARNALRGSVGSISQKRFYFFQQIRLEADLGRYATVLYSQEEESFFRQDELRQQLELRLGSGYYASLLGFPRHDKRGTEVGVALARGKRTDWNHVRYTRLQQRPFYNDKNPEPNEFERPPVTDRLEVQRFWNERLFVRLEWTKEHPARFQEFEPPVERRYEGREFHAIVDWWGPQREWVVGATYHEDMERRRQLPEAPSQELPDLRQGLEFTWLDLYGGWEWGADFVTLGYLDSYFSNEIDSGILVEQYSDRLATGQVYAFWERRPETWVHGLFSLQVGQTSETVRFGKVKPPSRNGRSVQAKFGASLVMREAERYRLVVNTTWDGDIFTRRAWDGGNVRLEMYF